jgi:hypothetical protein
MARVDWPKARETPSITRRTLLTGSAAVSAGLLIPSNSPGPIDVSFSGDHLALRLKADAAGASELLSATIWETNGRTSSGSTTQ